MAWNALFYIARDAFAHGTVYKEAKLDAGVL